jgi:diaphanous 1
MLKIPRYLERTSCIIFKRRFDMELEEIKPELNILRCAHDEMLRSQTLKRVLGVRSFFLPSKADLS